MAAHAVCLVVYSEIMERRKSARKVSFYYLSGIHGLTKPCLDSTTRKLHPSNHLAFKKIFEHLYLPVKQLCRHWRMVATRS